MFDFLQNQDCIISFSNTDNEKVQDFENIEYDLGISFLYTFKIPSTEFLRNKIWINFHPGPLPEYRGRNLCYHAILNQETQFGATLHYMDKEFDTGNIIEVSTFPIYPHYTAGDLSELSKDALVNLFKKYLPIFLEGKNISAEKQIQNGNYYKKTFIDNEVTLPFGDQLKVRAVTVSPHFYAHTIINGRKYFIIPEPDNIH